MKVAKSCSSTIQTRVECPECDSMNFVSEDLDSYDVEAVMCWKCGSTFLIDDETFCLDMLVEDLNVEEGSRRS